MPFVPFASIFNQKKPLCEDVFSKSKWWFLYLNFIIFGQSITSSEGINIIIESPNCGLYT